MDNKKMNSTGVEDHILDVEHLSMYFTTKNRGKKSTVKAAVSYTHLTLPTT